MIVLLFSMLTLFIREKKPLTGTSGKGRMIAVPPLFMLCYSKAYLLHPVTGISRESLLPFQLSGSKATFRKPFFKQPFSRWTALSGKSICVLLFLTTFAFHVLS